MFLATKLQFKYRKNNYIQYSSFLKISITQKQNSNLFILGTKIIHKEWKEKKRITGSVVSKLSKASKQ